MPVNDAGKKSRSTETFLVAADVEAFSALLAPKIEGMAAWSAPARTCRGADLVQALAADGVQAFLRLADGQGGLRGPLIQYLDGGVHAIDGREILPDGRHVPVTGRETLTPGRLAYAWFPADEPADIQERFPELARLAWGCLQQVTHPHVAAWNGKPTRSWRIGSYAKAWLREEPSRGIGGWGGFYRVVPP
jgi:hypothetical protein